MNPNDRCQCGHSFSEHKKTLFQECFCEGKHWYETREAAACECKKFKEAKV